MASEYSLSKPTGNPAKDRILGRIRAARLGTPKHGPADAEWSAITRHYSRRFAQAVGASEAGAPTTSAAGDRHAILERFFDRLRDYDARVEQCSAGEVASRVSAMLAARGVQRMVVPQGIPAEALPEGFEFLNDLASGPAGEATLSSAALDRVDGVLTLCTVAIAETGTLVLQNAPGQGRRALSLVPDYHLCIVSADDVVATVPEAFTRLAATATLATTFISGPSATADIEMTRIKGVHGPRFLDVLVIHHP